MRALLQRGETRDEPVALGALVEHVVDLLRSEAIGRGVGVVTAGIERSAAPMRGDPIQLTQVLLNLLMNAIEAASRAPAGRREVTVALTTTDDGVEVSVRDTGPGLATRDPEELFAPVVSGRPDGLGMGLAIARSSVEEPDGRIWGADHPDGGAVFRARFPRA